MRRRTFFVVAAAWVSSWACSTGHVPVMSWDEYVRTEITWPYVVSFESNEGGFLYYFGAAHTWDPDDPQLVQVEQAWRRFRPDIAFTEGGSPPIASSRDEAVRRHAEPGLVRFLAARDNVPTTTLDPSRAEEVAALTSRFTSEEVKLFFLLRAVSQFVQRSGTENVDAEVERILEIHAATPGLSGPPRSLASLEEAFARLFPDRGRYHDVPHSWFDPTRRETFLNEVARAGSDYRDRYVVARLVAHVREGRRVFAVMGGTHVVMQEPALRRQLRPSRHEGGLPPSEIEVRDSRPAGSGAVTDGSFVRLGQRSNRGRTV
jgi:hypothetical protein